jgi:thiosulfate/3-mercaptopyruvate sulfurtransferase
MNSGAGRNDQLPLVIDPEVLSTLLGAEDLLIVDLSKAAVHAAGHIPGAVHLDYARLVAKRGPAAGLVPDPEALSEALAGIGLTPNCRVVAYDDEGGGRAGRLLWTLDLVGHPCSSVLNGGLHAWANEGYPLDTATTERPRSGYEAVIRGDCRAEHDYIRENLGNPDVVLVDTRTAEEYQGAKRLAARGGHIPGAVHMDWVTAMDPSRNLRLKSEPILRAMLVERGVLPEREVIVYCQTHHRSSHTYVVLRSLGYPRVKGYPGAWSEWGNLPDAPIESYQG